MNQQAEGKFWRKGEFYLVALFFIFCLSIFVSSLAYPMRARLFPMLISGAGLILISLDMLQMLIPGLGRWFQSFRGGAIFGSQKAPACEVEPEPGETVPESPAAEEPTPAPKEKVTPLNLLVIISWFAASFILLYTLGYLAATVIFSFFFFKIYARLSWTRAIIITGVFSLFMWFIFSIVLHLDLIGGSKIL